MILPIWYNIIKKGTKEAKMEGYKESLRLEEKSEATVEKYVRDAERFRRYVEENGGEISKETVLGYKERLKDEYKISSANSIIASVNSYLRYLGKGGCCVKRYKQQREAFRPAEKELSREEYRRLLKAAEEGRKEKARLLVETVCGTGIRVSELKYITVEAVEKGIAEVSCKGKTRKIFIVTALRKKLLRYARARGIKGGAIFVSRTGREMDRVSVWRAMKGLCGAARVCATKVFPHNLRHLFARTFFEMEKDIAKLADILGHSSIDTTRIYVATTASEHRKRMECMRLVV